MLGYKGEAAQFFKGIAGFSRVTNIDGKTLQALYSLADVFTPYRGADDRLHVCNVQAKTCRRTAFDVDVYIAPAGQPFCQRTGNPWNAFKHPFDLAGQSVNGCKVSASYLDAHRTFDARCQHVNAVANGRYPDVRQARHLDDAVQFIDQLVLRHAGAPLVFGLELNRGLEHLHGCRISRAFGTPCFAIDTGNFWNRFDQPVGLLQQLTGLAGRQTRQRRRHVQQVTLIKPGHELTTNVLQGPNAENHQHSCNQQGSLGCAQHAFQQRPVGGNQEPVQRVSVFIWDASTYQVAHQHRNQGHRQSSRSRHGIGFGKGQRGKQAALLRLQREYRNEGKRDDQQ